MQCPDCKGWFVKLANHKKCRGRTESSLPVEHSSHQFTFSSTISLQETDRIRKPETVSEVMDPAAPVSLMYLFDKLYCVISVFIFRMLCSKALCLLQVFSVTCERFIQVYFYVK
jgi:hypothetical protein